MIICQCMSKSDNNFNIMLSYANTCNYNHNDQLCFCLYVCKTYYLLSHLDNRLFYCDAGSDTVGVVNTDGTNNRILYVNYVAVLTHFFHMIRVNDSLFVTNWDGEATTSARTTMYVKNNTFYYYQ